MPLEPQFPHLMRNRHNAHSANGSLKRYELAPIKAPATFTSWAHPGQRPRDPWRPQHICLLARHLLGGSPWGLSGRGAEEVPAEPQAQPVPSRAALQGAEPTWQGRRRQGGARARISFATAGSRPALWPGPLSSLCKSRRSTTSSPRSPAPGPNPMCTVRPGHGQGQGLAGRPHRQGGPPHPGLVRRTAGRGSGLPRWRPSPRAGLRSQPWHLPPRPPNGGSGLRPSSGSTADTTLRPGPRSHSPRVQCFPTPSPLSASSRPGRPASRAPCWGAGRGPGLYHYTPPRRLKCHTQPGCVFTDTSTPGGPAPGSRRTSLALICRLHHEDPNRVAQGQGGRKRSTM